MHESEGRQRRDFTAILINVFLGKKTSISRAKRVVKLREGG